MYRRDFDVPGAALARERVLLVVRRSRHPRHGHPEREGAGPDGQHVPDLGVRREGGAARARQPARDPLRVADSLPRRTRADPSPAGLARAPRGRRQGLAAQVPLQLRLGLGTAPRLLRALEVRQPHRVGWRQDRGPARTAGSFAARPGRPFRGGRRRAGERQRDPGCAWRCRCCAKGGRWPGLPPVSPRTEPRPRCGSNTPELWWPNGMGGQPLYDVVVTLRDGRGQRARHGVAPDRPADAAARPSRRPVGRELPVRGERRRAFFAKGANWIPADAFVTAAHPGRLRAPGGRRRGSQHEHAAALGRRHLGARRVLRGLRRARHLRVAGLHVRLLGVPDLRRGVPRERPGRDARRTSGGCATTPRSPCGAATTSSSRASSATRGPTGP